jgi:hypothetical protein
MPAQDKTRNWTNLPGSDAAQVGSLRVTDLITGPAVPVIRTEGTPNGTLTGAQGQLALDYATGTMYQNTDGASAWVVWTGGGGGLVTTASPIIGDGSGGSPVTYKAIASMTLLGNNNEIPATGPVEELTQTEVGAMLASFVPVNTDAAVMGGTGVSGSPLAPKNIYLGRQVFTGSGTYTPHPAARCAVLTMQGGGGGSGATTAGTFRYGMGGGGGVSWQKRVTNAGAVLTGGAVTIGAGGTAGVSGGAAAGAGGDTSCVINGVTYTAKGGSGGTADNTNPLTTCTPAGSVGLSSAADWRTAEPARPAVVISPMVLASGGGSSHFGAPAAPTATSGNIAGTVPNGFGAGASGAASASSGAQNGAVGGAGLVFVDEYA